MNKAYTLYYFSTVPFPNGGMATGNRVLHIAKGIAGSGVGVRVFSPFSDSGEKEESLIDGICYRSLCRMPKAGVLSGIRRRVAIWFLFPLRFWRTVRKEKDSDPIIYCYGDSPVLCFMAWLVARALHCPLCAERTEYPRSVLFGGSAVRRFIEKKTMRLLDGLVVITENLRSYYQKFCRESCSILTVPMTVDCDLYERERRSSFFDFDYIAYAGTMVREGGGVRELVRTFGILAREFPSLHLVLIGNGSDEIRRELLGLLDSSSAERCHFLFGGDVPRLDMPRYICNAKILAMLPLQTKQQEGCFPTKLGEYLASGVPTVVSRVGIPVEYLTDGVNIRFVPPGDPEATASVMRDILKNYDQACRIADAGRQFARLNFHYAKFGPSLAGWLRSLA